MFPAGKTKWLCRQCFKHLSSKRSYDEHMNIHNESRPFACDQCDYSAASQMTLRRHKLRNHVPRQAWGYQCPYCGEAYMEPASYQQHVLIRHVGRSATLGCFYSGCTFTTKSSKHFRNHLKKHIFVMSVRSPSKCFTLQPKYDIARYLVGDELGNGYGKPPLVPVARRVSALSIQPLIPGSSLALKARNKTNSMSMRSKNESIAQNTVNYRREIGPLHVYPPPIVVGDDEQRAFTVVAPDPKGKEPLRIASFTQVTTSALAPTDIDWIEAEVVIDDEIASRTGNQVEDFELD